MSTSRLVCGFLLCALLPDSAGALVDAPTVERGTRAMRPLAGMVGVLVEREDEAQGLRSERILVTVPSLNALVRNLGAMRRGQRRSARDTEVVAAAVGDRQAAELSFEAFPARRYMGNPGQITLPDFSGRDSWARDFRTRISDGLRAGANFAGHYSLIQIGCGTGCRFVYVADARNGEVFDFPYGSESHPYMTLEYRRDSRLVKVKWVETTWGANPLPNKMCIQYAVAFDGAEFVLLADKRVPENNGCE